MKDYLGYYAFRIFIFLFGLIPFFLLYLLSDFIYLLFFYVVGYRKAVVFENLRNSFPDKSPEQIKQIAKGFYKNLTDVTVEGLKGLTMSKKQLLNRYKVLEKERIDNYFDAGKNVIIAASHYTNWEWGALSLSLQFKHKVIGIVNPLSNKLIEAYFEKKRAQWGTYLVSIFETSKTFKEEQKKPAVYVMVSDQYPGNLSKAVWLNFLNQETPFLTGIEKYAKLYQLPVLYGDMQRVKRGYYTFKISVLIDNPMELKEDEITRLFMKKLEKIILKKPENWLWSHRRWKTKKGEIPK